VHDVAQRIVRAAVDPQLVELLRESGLAAARRTQSAKRKAMFSDAVAASCMIVTKLSRPALDRRKASPKLVKEA
jgi:hypothetical protein